MFSLVSSVRRVFGDRSLPHKERLLRPPLSPPSSQSLLHSPLAPTSQVSIEVFEETLPNSLNTSSTSYNQPNNNNNGLIITNNVGTNNRDIDTSNNINGTSEPNTESESERNGENETKVNDQLDPLSSYNLKESYRCKGLQARTPFSSPTNTPDFNNTTITNNSDKHEESDNTEKSDNLTTEAIENGDLAPTIKPKTSRRMLQESVGDEEFEIVVGENQQLGVATDHQEKGKKKVDISVEMDEIQEEEKEEREVKAARKKLMKKVSVLQLTTHHGSSFSTRQGAHDNFVIKLGKGDFTLDRGELHEYKGVVVDCTDYQVTVIPFIMALASALHTCGVPAHRMERALTLLSNCFGIESNFFYTPTGLFCSFNHPKPIFAKNKHTNMQLVRLPMVDWDMERLCFLEELCDDVVTSRIHVSEGVSAIQDIMSLPLRYTVVFEILASIVLSLGFAVLFGFSWSESRASGLAGIWSGLMMSIIRKFPSFHQLNSVISGFGAGIIASMFSLFVIPVHTLLAAVAALMYHLPSLSVTIAISELVTGNIVAGTSRLMGAWCAILQVAFGSWSGITLVGSFSNIKVPLPANPESWYWILFATFLASVGYSVLCRVPPKLMWVVFVSGTLGTLGGEVGGLLNASFGAFLGAFLICVFANVYARKIKRGLALIPIWSGMLLLVPGYVGLKGLISVSDLQLSYGTTQLVAMLQNATALALGLFSANVLAHPYKAL